MTTRCARARALVVVFALAGANRALGGVPVAVQFDMTPAFNADVILRYHDGALYGGQPIEDPYTLLTESASYATFCGAALPDGGEAPQAGWRPRIQLEFRNNDDGNNAWFVANSSTAQVTIAVKPLKYQEVQLLATSGVAVSNLDVHFHYATGADGEAHTRAPHWNEAAPPDGYVLFTVLPVDLYTHGSPFCGTDVHVFGLMLPVDDTRTLISFTVDKSSTAGALAVLGAIGIPAQTATNIDISAIFTNDVIANYTTAMDTQQDSFDAVGTILLTDGAAAALGCGPALPNSGAFGSGRGHPSVQLGFNNANFGNNAHMITGTSDDLSIFLPGDHTDQVHLFATCSSGSRAENYELHYVTGSTGSGTVTVPDWSGPSGYPATPAYDLSSRMDRATSTLANNCEDRNDLALFGAIIDADPSRILDTVHLVAVSSSARMGIFGLSLMKNHPYLFEDAFESGGERLWTAVVP